MGPLLRPYLLEKAHSTTEVQAQTPKAECHKIVQYARATLIATQPNIPTLTRDNVLAKAPLKNKSTTTSN
jgi:hypothetical protein